MYAFFKLNMIVAAMDETNLNQNVLVVLVLTLPSPSNGPGWHKGNETDVTFTCPVK